MSLQRNYYEVLGIPPGATTDQIKKKYRELARKFHPDVVQDKALGQKVFSQINQAYRVLVDPERRAQYNSTLQPVSPTRPPASPTRPPVSSAVVQQATVSTAQPKVAAAPQPKTPTAQPAATRPAAPAQPSATITRLLANADDALMQGKFTEARGFCSKVLEIEPGNTKALELLGDTLTQMGNREEAAVQYRRALQSAPSAMVQAKLKRVEQSATPTRTYPPVKEPEKANGGLLGRILGRK